MDATATSNLERTNRAGTRCNEAKVELEGGFSGGSAKNRAKLK
jgi:hypothetical protein